MMTSLEEVDSIEHFNVCLNVGSTSSMLLRITFKAAFLFFY